MPKWARTAGRYATEFTAIAALIGVLRALATNPTTAGFVFLVAVLVISAFWGLRYAIAMAIVSAAAFNFFFLPPLYTFVIADPHNWVAFFAFVAAALIASNLAERARREAAEATRRRSEAERLYALSQRLLRAEEVPELYAHLPAMITESFESAGAALFIAPDMIFRSFPDPKIDEESLRGAAEGSHRTQAPEQTSMPLRLRGRSVGALALVGPPLSNETYEALGSLIMLAMERTQAMEELTRNRALQENERLKNALLDSVAHEFRTPLTGIKASVTSLLSSPELDLEQHRELLTIIDEEADRLNRLVAQAAEMAQLDAGDFRLDLASCDVRELVAAAVATAGKWLNNRLIDVAIPEVLPHVSADFERMSGVFAQILENAGKYSEPGALIRVTAESAGHDVVVRISDTGPGIDEAEQARIFDKFFRGRKLRYKARGTGMGLAIAKVVVEAHGGTIIVSSRPGIGSVFTVRVGAAQDSSGVALIKHDHTDVPRGE